jgi:glycosyltransferase involved in cell wall biosynthesis
MQKPTKVAINIWLLRNKMVDGIGVVTIETVQRLIKNNPDVQFLLMCPKNFTENYFDAPNASKHFIFPALRHPLLYIFFLELLVPFFLLKHKPDVLLSMDGMITLLTNTKQVAGIYDLNFHHFPKDVTLKNRLYYGYFFRRFCKKATRIATLSEYSKADICNTYGTNSSKVDIIYCGVKEHLRVLTQEEKIIAQNKFSNGKPYFFFVGSMNPRKNINRLMLAFNQFKAVTHSDAKLVLGGYFIWQQEKSMEGFDKLQYKDDIIFTGRLSDEDLLLALGGSFALAFVPLFEGFGLPLVEAFACGVPSIASSVTSVPEVAGDAAILVDPLNVDEIAAGLTEIWQLPESQRQELISKGFARAKIFTWDKTADLLWQSVMQAVN